MIESSWVIWTTDAGFYRVPTCGGSRHMARSTTITMNGNPVEITDDQVFLATRDQIPGALRTYGVLVRNVLWTPKQLIALATGVPGRSGEARNHNSHAALEALNDLGFATFEPMEYDTGGSVVVRETRKRANGPADMATPRRRESRRLSCRAGWDRSDNRDIGADGTAQPA
ncbi:hypothetical protein OG935_06140 [Nocardia cyriacigeorgica]|uniref:hypothetical protein n=1 Tax=Nocardia cyriacigeorgica TaxID=135487 RepID=UPI002E1A124E